MKSLTLWENKTRTKYIQAYIDFKWWALPLSISASHYLVGTDPPDYLSGKSKTKTFFCVGFLCFGLTVVL